MDNLSDELSELSHDELQFVIDGFFLWVDRTMKQRGISIRGWKIWKNARKRAGLPYSKNFPGIMVEEQIEKMRELRKPELDKCYLVITFIVILREKKLFFVQIILRLLSPEIRD